MLKFYVDEQSVILKTNINVASDTIDFVELNFSFSDSWEGYAKTVQFTQKTNTYSIVLGIDETNCYLPSRITDGLCRISVFGVKDGSRRATSIPYQLRVKRSGYIEDTVTPQPKDLTIIEQLIEKTSDVEHFENIVDALDTKVDEVSDRVGGIETNITNINNKITLDEQLIDANAMKINEMVGSIADAKTDIRYLLEQNLARMEEIAELIVENDDQGKRIADLEEHLKFIVDFSDPIPMFRALKTWQGVSVDEFANPDEQTLRVALFLYENRIDFNAGRYNYDFMPAPEDLTKEWLNKNIEVRCYLEAGTATREELSQVNYTAYPVFTEDSISGNHVVGTIAMFITSMPQEVGGKTFKPRFGLFYKDETKPKAVELMAFSAEDDRPDAEDSDVEVIKITGPKED